MRLGRLFRTAPVEPQQRRRRRGAPRPDAPRTIVPVPDAAADADPMTLRLDAARERLRAAIPPVADDD